MRVLILSVGGSDVPLVRCIGNYRPDYIVFLCTEDKGVNKGSRSMVDGEGLVKEEIPCKKCNHIEKIQRPNIISQCGIGKESYEIHLVPHDDPYKCYEIALALIKQYLDNSHEVIVDYTGGTKSMSVGLAVAAMEFPSCNLSVVKGKRLDLIKVRDGMERVSRLPSNTVFVYRQKMLCQSLIKNWDYHGAVQVLEEIDRLGHVGNEAEFERMLLLSRGFAAWDKFDYWSAVEKIDLYKDDQVISKYNKRIKQICAILKWYQDWSPEDKKHPPVFILVYDVLLNAERRATQGNFDDAISRIYRATEMYGQLCLRTGNPRLTSDDIDLSLIPSSHRDIYEKKRSYKGKIQIGLKDDYDLLAVIGHPIKSVWEKKRERIIFVLNKRNYSFLAHGMEPLNEREYREVRDTIWDFIVECDKAQGIKQGLAEAEQLPTTFVEI